MTKALGTMVLAILALGSMTGCPDDTDDCTSDPSLCDGDTDSDVGADADADADSDTTEDDGDTSEAANCPSVAGDWTLTYVNEVVPGETHLTLTLEQDGCLVTGLDEHCEYSGTIGEDGYISLFRDCYTNDRTVTGNFTATPSHMEGEWYDMSRPDHGTWTADPQ